MMKGISLQELAQKIETQKGQKRDFIADTRTLTMQVPRLRDVAKEPVARPVLEMPDVGQFPLLPLCHDQVGERTGIPAKYYDRMLAEAPDLLATNVNAWFRVKPELRMLRTMGGKARAFLSNRYQRIENEAIADVALSVLAEEFKGIQVVSAEVTDKRLYIHFVLPSVQGEVKVGDVVQAGGIISNSEVGLGAAQVSGLLWRLICLNGAKTADTFRRYHIGRAAEEAGDISWGEDTQQSDDKTVLLKMRDTIRAVVDETRFKANLEKLQGLTEGKVTGDPVKVVELLAAKVQASEAEKGGILRSLIEGNDLSAWGLVNAVTAQSHNAQSYDRAVELEAAGGRLIELPKADWKEILQAA